jgi:hypothetical protein
MLQKMRCEVMKRQLEWALRLGYCGIPQRAADPANPHQAIVITLQAEPFEDNT